MLIHDIDESYFLSDPPELTREIATARWRQLNVLLHSIVLMGDEPADRRLFSGLLRTSVALASTERALLYRWNEADRTIKVVEALGFDPLPHAAGTAQVHASLVHRKPLMVWYPPDEFLTREMDALQARAALTVPITGGGVPWGAIQLLSDRPFMREEAVLLWLYALALEGLLPVLESASRRLSGQADSATTLILPIHFRRRLSWELQRSAALSSSLTVACVEMLDPLHGRPRAGAAPFTPLEASTAIRRVLESQSSLTCLGGHHFIVALPDVDRSAARDIIESIRRALVDRGGGTVPILDIVIGLATFPDDGVTEGDLIREACAAARRGRRNHASPERISRNPLAS